MRFLHVHPQWGDGRIYWPKTDLHHLHGYGGLGSALLGYHFAEIHLCMIEIHPLLKGRTLDDLLGRYQTRLERPGKIVLDYSDPIAFFRRRPPR